MAKSALLKSSLGKKYWMALTGLFLCLFLVGHLLGNLQLLSGGKDAALNFNKYALFMTSNPAVKLLSYLTYFSILFHAVDGILLAVKNKKARPIQYAKENPQANTIWASRNMAVLGTLILVFIVTHMVNFWSKMHFDENMPLQTITIENGGASNEFYVTTDGSYLPVSQFEQGILEIKNRTDFYDATAGVKMKEGYKDLYKITVAFFKNPDYGLIASILYTLAMVVLGFHLYHGFGSAFQSMGANSPKYTPFITNFGKAFSILVPLLFAIIPLYIHFIL
ncbi:succinate dehydrogenase cytochrome b subunit [Flavobacterium litorale]|uniref:Succinate dehydrogenase cytochrome b subunit n=1 Tax=Flavobacterium litorale TaxID=2856519 RepID=A0ABX8V8K7_9FLAO|nr:succinate dehydrogenase cytochrome b subunit [Flavobacterium litorale]QYJ68852.1 succinate dehydrogenase cytochrome b subunit [Flavobacterium litorale]